MIFNSTLFPQGRTVSMPPLPTPPMPRGRVGTPLILGAVLTLLIAIGGGAILVTQLAGGQGPGPTVVPAAQQSADSDVAAEPVEIVSEPMGDVPLSNADLAAEFGDAVFKVEAEGCGMQSSGSAWVLDEHHLVTNAHVIATDPTPAVVSRDGSVRLTGTVIGAEADPDVAIIRVEETLPTALKWAPTAELTEGQDIVALGYPAPAGDFSVIPSTIISFQQDGGVREAIRSDGAVDHGNSGGPAITRDGAVAGVVTLMLVDPAQLQMVPILFTADALESTVAEMVANPDKVEADCDGTPYGVVPDGWDVEGWGDFEQAGAAAYGDDAHLDSLWDACASGDLDACDDLYLSSGWGSEYEEFGATCGQTTEPAYGACQAYAEWEAEAAAAEEEQRQADEAARAAVQALLASCNGGDMQACDDLQWEASYGSAEYEVAESCGGHYPDGWASCVDREADALEQTEHAAYLTELSQSCEGGDMQACDDLQWEASYGSAEYEVAESCGGHYPDGWGSCIDRQTEAAEVEALSSACQSGDMEACDDLWFAASPGTHVYDVAADCGGLYPGQGGMCAWAQEDETP